MDSGSNSLPLRGLVLAGGRARRLEGRKASRKLHGVTWLERAAQQLRPVCDSVFISVRSSDDVLPPWAERLLDVDHSGESQGPLAALHALVMRETCDAWVLACDYPLVSTDLVEKLLTFARTQRPAALCLAVTPSGMKHPLAAFWPLRRFAMPLSNTNKANVRCIASTRLSSFRNSQLRKNSC